MKQKDQNAAAAPEESAAGSAAAPATAGTGAGPAAGTGDSPAPKPRARRRGGARRAKPAAAPEAPVVAPSAEEIARVRRMFTRAAAPDAPERFLFARWRGPIRPLALGLDAEGASRVMAGVAAVAAAAGVETAPPAASAAPNILLLFCADWSELADMPGLERLIPGLRRLLRTLEATGRDRKRLYNLSPEQGLRLSVALTRCPDGRAAAPLETMALGLACGALLPWSEAAFEHGDPVAPRHSGRTGLRRWHAALLKAANDSALPVWSEDPALAAILAASVAAALVEPAAAADGEDGEAGPMIEPGQ